MGAIRNGSRRALVIALAVLALFASSFIALAPTAHATPGQDDYPYRNYRLDQLVDKWNFFTCECTSFVAWRLNIDNHMEEDGRRFSNQYRGVAQWGHAWQWGGVAKNLGIKVDSTPSPGAVAWWGTGRYGHVAWVRSVDGNNVVIEEYNWARTGRYGTRTINKNEPSGYIHIYDLDVYNIAKAKITGVKQMVYNGKKRTQKKLVVTDVAGRVLKEGKHYTVAYKNNVQMGTATLTVKGKGKYKKSQSVTFKIGPAPTRFLATSSTPKTITAAWVPVVKNTTGYRLRIATKKDMSGAQEVTVGKRYKAKLLFISLKLYKFKYEFTGLEKNTTYYLQVQTYAKVKGKKHYSEWSKVKKKKTKDDRTEAELMAQAERIFSARDWSDRGGTTGSDYTYFKYGDFDGDGVHEAWCIAGEKSSVFASYSGYDRAEVHFLRNGTDTLVAEQWLSEVTGFKKFGKYRMLITEGHPGADRNYSEVFGVKKGVAQIMPFTGKARTLEFKDWRGKKVKMKWKGYAPEGFKKVPDGKKSAAAWIIPVNSRNRKWFAIYKLDEKNFAFKLEGLIRFGL